MATKTVLLRQFNGGMATDPRDPSVNLSRYAVNFDILSNPYKLSPYNDSESGDSAASTSMKRNWCVALRSGTTYNLFALGVKSGASTAEILMKTLTTGGSNDLSDAGWATPTNNQSASGTTNFNLFTYYKTTNTIYGAKAGTALWGFDPSSGTAFSEDIISTETSAAQSGLVYTNICEGLVHSMNDIMYIGYDNKIASNNNKVWTKVLWTLPSNLYMTSLAEDGNYLVAVAAPLSGVGSSKTFLFNLANPGTTWDIMTDCGEGTVKIARELGGVLITISSFTDVARNLSRIVFREYTGSGMEPFLTLQGATSDLLLAKSQRVDNRILFMMMLTVGGVQQAGVWSISKSGSRYAVTQESTINNNTAIVAGDVIGGFIKVSGFTFQAYTVSSSWALSKTNDQASYTATSIYQTTINEGMAPGDKIEKKQLISAGLMYESLPAAGQAILKYRVNGSSWTTIFTETTDGVVYTEPFTNAGGAQYTAGKEYEFRAESTGGTEITGILYKYSVIPTNV